MKNLINTWLIAQHIDVDSDEYDDVSWAIDELYQLAHDKPHELLDIVKEILNLDSSKKILGALGAGVLEDLLVYHGNDCIDKIVDWTNANKAFHAALQFTYIDQNDVSL